MSKTKRELQGELDQVRVILEKAKDEIKTLREEWDRSVNVQETQEDELVQVRTSLDKAEHEIKILKEEQAITSNIQKPQEFVAPKEIIKFETQIKKLKIENKKLKKMLDGFKLKEAPSEPVEEKNLPYPVAKFEILISQPNGRCTARLTHRNTRHKKNLTELRQSELLIGISDFILERWPVQRNERDEDLKGIKKGKEALGETLKPAPSPSTTEKNTLTKKECVLEFETDSNVKTQLTEIRSKTPGPDDFALTNLRIVDQYGSPVRVLNKDKTYKLCMKLIYTSKIGYQQPEFTYSITIVNVTSCQVVESMCFRCMGILEAGSTGVGICVDFKCSQEGAFSIVEKVVLEELCLIDFRDCFDFCFACQHSCIHDIARTMIP